jgi:DnaJ-class molecular chaperone with C-terminal Zn finger domain
MALIVVGVFVAYLIGRVVRLLLLRLKVIKDGERSINDIALTYLLTFGLILIITRWQARLFLPGIIIMVLYDIARLKISIPRPATKSAANEMNDPYTILGVHRSDSLEKIKQVYRKLQETYHPDKHAADSTESSMEQKTEKIKQINAAFEWILKNHDT